MSMEQWKDIAGFEGRYQVSDLGRVKSLAHPQRYVLRNGQEHYRMTREKIIAQQNNNSGYPLVHLHLDNKRTAVTVHTLVAEAFVEPLEGETVNHIDGVKTNNAASNLEWATYTENHNHAVETGLNKQAHRVVDPRTGQVYASRSKAAKVAGKAARRWGLA
jgi:hypothetical protein